MDKEEYFTLLERFVKTVKARDTDGWDWCIEEMETNEEFELYGENLKEKFLEMLD